jgi:hypothetical protein
MSNRSKPTFSLVGMVIYVRLVPALVPQPRVPQTLP